MQPNQPGQSVQPPERNEIMWPKPKAPVEPAVPVWPVPPIQPTVPVWPVALEQSIDPVADVAHSPPLRPIRPVQPVHSPPPTSSFYVDTSAMLQSLPSGGAPSATYRVSQFVYLLFGIGEALMVARVVLKLLAANGDASFVRFVYGVSAPLVAPFQGIFPTPAGNGSVVERSSLVAIVVYALVAWAIVRFVSILARQPTMPPAH